MDVLFLNHNVGWSGGTFFRAFGFARELACLGHRVTLVTIAPSARVGTTIEHRDGVEIIYSPDLFWGRGRTGWDPWDVLNRMWVLRGRRWDIVHAWDSRPAVIVPALYAAATSRGSGGRLVMDWCDWWGRGGTQAERSDSWMTLVAPVETFFEERFRHRSDGTTVISTALLQRARGLGLDPQRILILPQGCNVAAIAGDRDAARARLGLAPDAQLLVSVGALNRSDAALLFDTLRRVLRDCPACHFALIGKHGATVPADLSSHPRFHETGYVSASTLEDYVAGCDALLALLADTTASRARWPSKVNGFLSAGRVPVMTRVGDLAALLEREGAAAIADPRAEDVANCVVRLLEDRDERDRIAHDARRVAETELAWPILTRRLAAFYQSTASAAATPGIS